MLTGALACESRVLVHSSSFQPLPLRSSECAIFVPTSDGGTFSFSSPMCILVAGVISRQLQFPRPRGRNGRQPDRLSQESVLGARAARARGKTVAVAQPVQANGKEETEEITFRVPRSLLAAMPSELRTGSSPERDRHLCMALEIGLKALAAGVSLDTSLVREAFAGFTEDIQRYHQDSQSALRDLLSSHISGEDSRLARMLAGESAAEHKRLNLLLEDTRRRMVDPESKASLPGAVLELLRGVLGDEERRVSNLVNAADPKSPVGFFLEQQRQAVSEMQNNYYEKVIVLEERLERQMAEIRNALQVDEKLQALQEQVDERTQKSTQKGTAFEDDGYDALVAMASTFGDRVEACGTATVSGTKRKIGDLLVHINQPGTPPGLCLVVEMKSGRCARKAMLEQLATGMEFRGAQAGIGIMQRQYLGKRQSAFEQHGPKQIIVGVDWSEQTDWFALEVAYRTLRAHMVASALQKQRREVDAEEVRARIKNVEGALGSMQRVKVNATA
eukprot:CAMPEP_0115322832 /NCGR_PEP_ID=MMETSP0270-20121206/81610_1 /TAXON_ID=71861 /ORGANISM="Scrippsiella trochoidea, Strain CCMP3099" /LENGTH=503 /DNA_ID=CAMNT_0002742819 /DNA_START=1 /DNA_END=1509 /DNA_ORIENTATION=+